MVKVSEVMSHAVVTCTPETNVSSVAIIMRDRDIGDVLIVEDGKLRGIVTDRDLALQALTGEDDPRQVPISRFMSTRIVTGDYSWSLEQAAQVMAKNQIRRLPIVRDGQLAGIVSLGDVSRHTDRKDVISKSLRAVSTPAGITAGMDGGHAGTWIGVALAAATASLLAYFTWTRTGQQTGQQILKHPLVNNAKKVASVAVDRVSDKVDEAASSKQVRQMIHQLRSELKDIQKQLPSIEYKQPKHKKFLFM